MEGWGKLLIVLPKRRVGSPVFLFAVVGLGLLPLAMIPSAIMFMVTGAIVAFAFGLMWMWNREPRIEELHEGGLVVKLVNGRRYARWPQVVRIESVMMRTRVYVVHLTDGDSVKVVPAADGAGTAQQLIDEIAARAGFAWNGTTATRPMQSAQA